MLPEYKYHIAEPVVVSRSTRYEPADDPHLSQFTRQLLETVEGAESGRYSTILLAVEKAMTCDNTNDLEEMLDAF